ncbi:hypothetical protein [Microbacterium sp. RURRCA19A]|uniref:hypothetical protein n=1 Tax=Microbacterium sp. RURRCA19A TaxID=1907391 RepID=UPI000954A233|nr:hypothetical protein [Microbacterium sp. RURRCA19A]SIR55238.1 hypothetical protein SAMN05880568_0416 [Microbacterium sp. RURRCA19A]
MHPTPLPQTIDTVAGYLRRRGRSSHVLTAGEAATLAIAVVRGCAAAPSRAAPGEWRLTAEGQPVLVAHPGGEDVLAVTVAILDEVASLVSADVRPGFARLRDGVLTEPPPTWSLLEKRLLAVVEPQPLVLGPLAPVASTVLQAVHDDDAASSTLVTRLRDVVRRIRPPVMWTGAGLAGVLVFVAVSLLTSAEATEASGEQTASGTVVVDATTPSASPGRGAAVTSPADETTTDTDLLPAGQDRTASGPEGDGASSGDDDPLTETTSSDADDVRSAATDVLRSLAACADEECVRRLWESPDGSRDPVPLDPAIAELELIDDYGGLAVVRLTADDRTQYATLVRQEDRWLVRSVRDVADQPS